MQQINQLHSSAAGPPADAAPAPAPSYGTLLSCSPYHIRVGGDLEKLLTIWFADLTICRAPGDETHLLTPPIDQTALHGILAILRDLAIPLIAVWRADLPMPPG